MWPQIGLKYHRMLIDSKPLICKMLSCFNFKEALIMKVVKQQIHKCRVLLGQVSFNKANLPHKEDGRLQDNKLNHLKVIKHLEIVRLLI